MGKIQVAASWLAVFALAVLLVGGGAVAAAAVKDDCCEGKVVSYEKAKCLQLEVGADKKDIKLDGKTEIVGEVAPGAKVKVTCKDGVAVKVEVQK
jgi:hypothetical protein